MRAALQEAQRAYEIGEIPVGAVLVGQGRILVRGHNRTQGLDDVTAHAELVALSGWPVKYLPECTLYVTLEPCPMCAGALYWAQLGRLVYGASDDKRGYSRHQPTLLHPRTRVTAGILGVESSRLLRQFFGQLR